jgi:hypothetical protein
LPDPPINTFKYQREKLRKKGTLRNVHEDAVRPSPVCTPAKILEVAQVTLIESTWPATKKRHSLRKNPFCKFIGIQILYKSGIRMVVFQMAKSKMTAITIQKSDNFLGF